MAACNHRRCERAPIFGDDKCILHSGDPEKCKDSFEDALENHLAESSLDFSGMTVPIPIEFDGREFGSLQANDALFLEPVIFLDCTFEGSFRAMDSDFEDELVLVGCMLEEGAFFRKTRVEGFAEFTDVEISRSSDFSYSHFGANVEFHGATLHSANFSVREFQESVNFRDVVFTSGGATFHDTQFRGEALFGGSTFEDYANFNSIFEGEANFSRMTSKSSFNLSNSEFCSAARFDGSDFRGRTDIVDTNFRDRATFSGARFLEDTEFSGGSFREADFSEVEIGSDMLFSGVFASGGETDFEQASFDEAHVRGSLIIGSSGEQKRPFTEGSVSLQNITKSAKAEIQLRYADLSRCRLQKTDPREVDFLGVRWCEKVTGDRWVEREWFNRVGIYDEVVEAESDSQSWPEIERLYRRLKLNYEKRGDFPRAGDFHIGEKEARRRNPETRWGPWLLLNAYRALSKYGERALPASLWLVGTILVCTAGYVFQGAIPGGSASALSPGNLSGWARGLVVSAESTFFPVQSADFQNVGPRLLNVFQRVISPPIIALLALALRQRVKR